MLTKSGRYKKSGIGSYNTTVAKFLHGGMQSDNPLRSGGNKIVNGMEDPSHLAFIFGIVEESTGLFATLEGVNSQYDAESDRGYGALRYLYNCVGTKNLDNRTTFGMSDNDFEEISDNDSENEKKAKTERNNAKMKSATDSLSKSTERYQKPGALGQTLPKLMYDEYDNMFDFVYGFRSICNKHQYYFQTVEGLQDAYKKYHTSRKDPYLGGTDNKIKITCLESMDLRMTALFDAYYRAVYNHKYRRMNLPTNLIRFNCYILLHDLRNVMPPGLTEKEQFEAAVNSELVENMSTVLFVFKNCIIDVDECGQSFSTTANNEVAETKFDFTFSYGDVDISVASLADYFYNEGEFTNPHRQYYDKLDISVLNREDGGSDGEHLSEYTESEWKEHELGNQYDGDTLDFSRILKRAGSAVFNYLTSGTQFGNVYDESWSGIVASMVSSVSNGGLHSLMSNYVTRGKTHVMEKIDGYAQDRFGRDFVGGSKPMSNGDLNPDKPNRGGSPWGGSIGGGMSNPPSGPSLPSAPHSLR